MDHYKKCRQVKPESDELSDNTKITDKANNRHELFVKEALHINKGSPKINQQNVSFIHALKLYSDNNNFGVPCREQDNIPNIINIINDSKVKQNENKSTLNVKESKNKSDFNIFEKLL